ncbi:hypothetical protein [Prevotella histicola]|uniref:hypothetical protein n=1 Tax=Prevotella histicola TaxID=470565 RepID=UPI0028E6562B|nr:hypothetical protein [Prevotella histicola]
MNSKILSLYAAVSLGLLVSCANDDTSSDQNQQGVNEKNMTAFVTSDNTPSTRTTAEYDGSGLNFFWTEGDHLWVDNTTASPASLQQDTRNNISNILINNTSNPAGVKRASQAKFWFEGTFTANSYNVRYTGKNGTKDKVTIKSQQSQTVPNDASHIGEDGDCGVATATKGATDGKYYFTLDHKASYLTFMPYYDSNLDPTFTPGLASSVKLTKIKVSADQDIAGTYNFENTGIDLSSVTSASKEIALTLSNSFEIPVSANYSKNGATMVIAPGSYTNFTVEYTLFDQKTSVTLNLKKNYGNITCSIGKNKKIATKLDIPNYSDTKWATWDSQHYYWEGHENNQPRVNGETIGQIPQNASDPRWYNSSSSQATNLCVNCPNINEMFWYISNGAAHWDSKTVWCVWGHLYQGGMWFLKKNNIPAFNSNKWYDGRDYRLINNAGIYVDMSDRISTADIPESDRNKYFFLPATDNMGVNWSPVGVYGNYWTSTPTNGDNTRAYALLFSQNIMKVLSHPRDMGLVIQKFQ